jgi:hypothetical protein
LAGSPQTLKEIEPMKSPLLTGFLCLFLVPATALLPSCGGGGGGGSGGGTQGTITVSLTDAAANEVESFDVTVSSIVLHKSNGTDLQVLSGPVTVDLADNTTTSQVLASLGATVGTYPGATVTFDLSTASCVLVGQSTPATILDDQGNPIAASVVVELLFPSFFALGSGAHKLAEFDLDLAQSLQIDNAANSVRFMPSLLVRTNANEQKPLFLLGTLASVDVAGSSFVVALTDGNGAPTGNVTCASTLTTVFQTDGVPAAGVAGLTALSLMTVGTSLQVQATLDPAAPAVQATNVNAGLGTWNGGTDIIEGHVIDRAGGAGLNASLAIVGRSSNAAHTSFQFDTLFTVTTSFANTRVVRHASATAYDTDEINIGQHVRVFGALTGTDMDATTGVLREQPTLIYGAAVGAPAGGQLAIALDTVGLRDVAAYNWTIDPANILTGVGTLANGLAIVAGTHVVELGYFSGVAGGATDFTAGAVVNADTAPALMFVRNLIGTGFDVALTCGLNQIDVTITGSSVAGEVALIDQGFVGQTTLPTLPTPNVVPAVSLGLYMIRDGTSGGLLLFVNFTSFSQALGNMVGAGAQIRHFAAVGGWDPVTDTLSAGLVSVLVQ